MFRNRMIEMEIDEISLNDWIMIYEHLDGDRHLSVIGKTALDLMKGEHKELKEGDEN